MQVSYLKSGSARSNVNDGKWAEMISMVVARVKNLYEVTIKFGGLCSENRNLAQRAFAALAMELLCSVL